ncbi:MAG TPA: hypothetical protein VG963_06590, partial [Polyangiaceae bacterium]|nr:hypothetical protein [Polyangiaceae bacterium]
LQDDASPRDNANTSSRYATIEALVDHGTYAIDATHYVQTIDKYMAGGHYISSKPPTLPTLAAGVYWVYEQLTGKTIARAEGPIVRLTSLFTGGLGHLIFLIYFYRLCVLLLRRDVATVACMAGACFGYLGIAYATRINELSTAAALGICGLYYACAIRHGHAQRPWHWVIAGLVLGLLPAIDLPGLAISGLIGMYLLAHDWRKTLIWFVPALLPGLVTHLALTYAISGSLKPFYFNSDLKAFKGFAFHGNAGGIDAVYEQKATYAFNVLLGHHGVFSMTPLLAFGLWELVSCLRRRRLLRESLVCAGAVAAFFTFFIWRTHNYGGWCVGMRWLVPVMPFLLLYFGVWIDRVRLHWRWCIPVLAAFAVSGFNVQDGLENPYQYSLWHNWVDGASLNRNRLGGRVFNVRVTKKRGH